MSNLSFAGIFRYQIKSRFFAVTMTANPFRAKAEERAKLCKKDEDDTERPAKRMCNQYEKQMAKMSGDLQIVKEHIENHISRVSINVLNLCFPSCLSSTLFWLNPSYAGNILKHKIPNRGSPSHTRTCWNTWLRFVVNMFFLGITLQLWWPKFSLVRAMNTTSFTVSS